MPPVWETLPDGGVRHRWSLRKVVRLGLARAARARQLAAHIGDSRSGRSPRPRRAGLCMLSETRPAVVCGSLGHHRPRLAGLRLPHGFTRSAGGVLYPVCSRSTDVHLEGERHEWAAVRLGCQHGLRWPPRRTRTPCQPIDSDVDERGRQSALASCELDLATRPVDSNFGCAMILEERITGRFP